jgi:hypothetical protein
VQLGLNDLNELALAIRCALLVLHHARHLCQFEYPLLLQSVVLQQHLLLECCQDIVRLDFYISLMKSVTLEFDDLLYESVADFVEQQVPLRVDDWYLLTA